MAVDKDRYFSVMLTDGNAYNYGYMGSRTTGTEAGNYLDFVLQFAPATPDDAQKNGWIVISMKNDWRLDFAFEEYTNRSKDCSRPSSELT